MAEGSILTGESVPQGEDDRIHTIFEQLAANNQDKTIVIYGDTALTLDQVNREANRVARRLLESIKDYSLYDVNRKDKIVCLLMPPCADRVIAILALWKLGIAYLPLETVIPVARIRFILREAKPMCTICSEELFPHINRTDIHATSVRSFQYERLAADAKSFQEANLTTETLANNIHDSSLAVVLYTSGSTGVPKGVRLTHKNILNRLRWQWREFPYDENDFCIAKTSILFVDSVTEIWSPLLKGIPIVIVPKSVTQNPQVFIETLEKNIVTRLVLVPSLLRTMLLYLNMVKDYSKLSKLTYVICSGETLPIELAKEFFKYFKEGHTLANYYGSTETTGDVTFEVFHNPDDVERMTFKENLSIGRIVDNCTAYLVDEEMQTVPLGEVGELVVSGLNIADGFMDPTDMASFLPNTLGVNKDKHLLRTGDFARIIDGRIYYEGRKDSQVKVRGQRVDTSEIARTLKRHDSTEQVVVLVQNAKEGDPTLVAFYTSKENKDLNAQLEKFCKDSLPPYMIPAFLHLNEIPLLPATGKIDRQALQGLYKTSKEISGSGGATFADEITGKVINMIAKELGLHPSHVELGQNFFEIGGNSVNAIQALAALTDAGIKIEIADFLSAKCLDEIVQLAKGVAKSSKNRLEALEEKYEVVVIDEAFSDWEAAKHLVAVAFTEKEIIDVCAGINYGETRVIISRIQAACQKSRASFTVFKELELVGASFAADVDDMPTLQEIFAGERSHLIGDVLMAGEVFLEGKLAEGRWLSNVMSAADSKSNPEDNLEVMELLERKTIELARKEGYVGVETTNTSHVTTQLGRLLGYESAGVMKLCEVQDKTGKVIFPSAPEDAIIDVVYLHL